MWLAWLGVWRGVILRGWNCNTITCAYSRSSSKYFSRHNLPIVNLYQRFLITHLSVISKPTMNVDTTIGDVEHIIAYAYTNKVWCAEALQMMARETKHVVGETIHIVSKNQNLVVLGDKVLDVVLCKLWFQFRNAESAEAVTLPRFLGDTSQTSASSKGSGIMASARQCCATRISTLSVGYMDFITRSLPVLAFCSFPRQW
jgi:hypothetical protein